MQDIGGHPGLIVQRHPIQGNVLKLVTLGESPETVEANTKAIHNEAAMLQIMSASGFTPELVSIHRHLTYQQDLGESEPVTDPELFRRNCVKMLATIRARGLRHGDLTASNIIVRNNHPYAIDWQESHDLDVEAPQKSPYSDSWLLMRALGEWPDQAGQCDTPRVARRWKAVLEDQGADRDLSLPLYGKTLLDLGCFQGDFTALAAAEGMKAYGVDRGGFRTGENSIVIGTKLWAQFPFGELGLYWADIVTPPPTVDFTFEADIALLFSTWPYMVLDYGREKAEEVLARIIEQCGVLYFETQLAGDGPGPTFFKIEADVGYLLGQYGAAKALVTIPVTGRDAERTVWRVQS